jgi:hypothetical protein
MKRVLKLCLCASHPHSLFAQHRQKRTREAFIAEEISFVTASWCTTAFVMGYFNLFNPMQNMSHLKALPCMACVYLVFDIRDENLSFSLCAVENTRICGLPIM